MVIRFDPLKRHRTLEQRGPDFLDAERVFAGRTLEFEDLRRDDGEVRTVCMGLRRTNEKEQLRFRRHFS